jgi:hypothetical protein
MSPVRDRERIAALLREQPVPGETEAAARSWPVVEAALAERRSGSAGRSRSAGLLRAGVGRPAGLIHGRAALRLAFVCALLAAGLVAALSPAGAEVGDWIGDRFAGPAERGAPAFAALPDGDSVLAISRNGAYTVSASGTSHLGPFSDAGWSPRGLHAVGVDGHRLAAVTPTGAVKWTITEARRVHHPAWSRGDGFAVVYLEGTELRTVAGDGTLDSNRTLRRDAAPVTPAWRSGSDRVLAYATTHGAVETVDIATGQALSRAKLPGAARALAWTAKGRLVALSARAVTVLDRAGSRVVTVALPGAARELAVHPSGRRAAVLLRQGAETRVVEVRLGSDRSAPSAARPVFQGDVDGIAWSRDGRELLVGWRGADQWLLFGRHGRVKALHDVSDELGAAGGFPRVVGWCCPGG